MTPGALGRRHLLLAALLLSVALAGCTEGFGGLSDLEDTERTDRGAPSEEANASNTSDGDAAGAETVNRSGNESGEEAVEDALADLFANETDATTVDDTASGDNESRADLETEVVPEDASWVRVIQPWTTETLQIRYENETYRDVRLAGILAPAHQEPVSANHGFAKIGSDKESLECLDTEAHGAWKYLHNTGSVDYHVVRDNETAGVHLVERGGAATLNERYLREGYAQYEGSGRFAERYRLAQRRARENVTNAWFCAPAGTEW